MEARCLRRRRSAICHETRGQTERVLNFPGPNRRLFRNGHLNPKANVAKRFARASAIGMLDLGDSALVSNLHS
jgi:hypothetical protein